MFWLFLAFLVVMLFGAKVTTSGTADYLSIKNTQAIKGIFILVVFFSHFNSYVTFTSKLDLWYVDLFMFIGQAMVTMFLFYSGYGVMESIKRKGAGYVRQIPQKRVLSTCFKFDCAVVLYVLLAFILGDSLTLPQVLLSLIGWDSVGNSNWYIFVIMVLYLLTYLVFVAVPAKNRWIPALVFSAALCVLVLLTKTFQWRPIHWYDTALCYALGMLYSLAKPWVEKMVNRHVLIWAAAMLACFALFVLLRGRGFLNLAAYLAFTVGVVLLTMRVTLCNRALVWCGEHLFEVYILQRIPMIVFDRIGFVDWNVPLAFVASLAVTVGLTFVFGRFTNWLWQKLTVRSSASPSA